MVMLTPFLNLHFIPNGAQSSPPSLHFLRLPKAGSTTTTIVQAYQPPPTSTHSISPNILPLPRQRLKHPRRQLVSNQARENHQILGHLEIPIGQYLPHLILKRTAQQMLAMPRAAPNAPEEHVANIARNLGRVHAEAVCGFADLGQIAAGAKREDVEVGDTL